MHYPLPLLRLIDVLRKLPGVGTKSAERFAFEMMTWPEEKLHLMAQVIHETATALDYCQECGCLVDSSQCYFCHSSKPRTQELCVVANARDIFSIESTGEYKGLYHVLGGVLSPMRGIGPEQLNIRKLKERINSLRVHEVIMALDSTLEGDATALFLKEELKPLEVHLSRLAFGVPMGSSLDYVDGGTLARALSGRARF